jgi:hypothetical protein
MKNLRIAIVLTKILTKYLPGEEGLKGLWLCKENKLQD